MHLKEWKEKVESKIGEMLSKSPGSLTFQSIEVFNALCAMKKNIECMELHPEGVRSVYTPEEKQHVKDMQTWDSIMHQKGEQSF